jgi:hypothetical protein
MVLPITPYLLYLLLLIGFSWFMGLLGRDFKFGFWGNFLVSLIFTPIVGILVLLAQDRRRKVD